MQNLQSYPGRSRYFCLRVQIIWSSWWTRKMLMARAWNLTGSWGAAACHLPRTRASRKIGQSCPKRGASCNAYRSTSSKILDEVSSFKSPSSNGWHHNWGQNQGRYTTSSESEKETCCEWLALSFGTPKIIKFLTSKFSVSFLIGSKLTKPFMRETYNNLIF